MLAMKDKLQKVHEKTRPVRDFVRSYLEPRHIAAYSASGAFWLFLSLVPTVILLTSILPYTSLTEEALLATVSGRVPASMEILLREIILDVYNSSRFTLSLSALTTLWSASMGFSALIRGLQEIYERPQSENYFIRRLKGILYTLAFMTVLILSLLLSGLNVLLRSQLEAKLPFTSFVFSWFDRLRFIVMPALLTVVFAAIYRWAPGIPLRFRDQLPGALLAALGWSVFSWGFSLWLSLTDGYGTYGSLATVAIAMVWFYYCMMILLMGGALNRGLLEHRRKKNEV